MPQLPFGTYLLASIIASLGLVGIFMTTIMPTAPADMHVEPPQGSAVVGETFSIQIIVESQEPVNVFKGLLRFDPAVLQVESIDYNTSVADLWAVEPWYSNGEGTLNFIGGTTRPGGFVGEEALITVTFVTTEVGSTRLTMDEVRILRHDGLGTDAPITTPIDALFTIDQAELAQKTVVQKTALGPELDVLPQAPSTDLNNDGKQTIADTSIFMSHLATQNLRSDFNMDGRVGIRDLSILMDQ